MNFQIFLIGLIMILTNIAFIYGSEGLAQSSKLPKHTPAKIEIRYFSGGGRSRQFQSVVIAGDILSFEIRRDREEITKKWAVRITREDKEKLYQVFVSNKFDLIQNDEEIKNMYDMPSQIVTLTVDDKTYTKRYARYLPMSGKSLEHFIAVYSAIMQVASNNDIPGSYLPDH